MQEDRRRHPRFGLRTRVHVRSAGVTQELLALDVSRSGALLDLGDEPRPSWLAVREEVDVTVLDAKGFPLVKTRGQIVRVLETLDHRTFAVQFAVLQNEEKIRAACRSAGRPPPLPKASAPRPASPAG